MHPIDEAAAYIRANCPHKPTVGIVLGSGLGALAEQLEEPCVLPYADIPHFARSTAPGHAGRLVIGRLAGKTVCCMQGRLHYYEGHPMRDIVFPVRLMSVIGVDTLVLTNAAGGLDPAFSVGDLMLITDHINFMGTNPLIGENDDRFGPRFPDMTACYTPALQNAAQDAALALGISLREGVYLAVTGPSYETPAEIRMFRALGASAVGMSTVPEAIAASHCGMKVAGISCVTNMGAGMSGRPLSSDEVLETTARTGASFTALVKELIRRM